MWRRGIYEYNEKTITNKELCGNAEYMNTHI